MQYKTLNDNVLVEKIETQKLVVSGQDEDPNATMHGVVIVGVDGIDEKLQVVFIRGQARKIKLENKEYFIVKKENLLLCRKG